MALTFREHFALRVDRYRRLARIGARSTINNVRGFPSTVRVVARYLSRPNRMSLDGKSPPGLSALIEKGRVYVINLDHRRDRRAEVEREFDRLFGQQPERFSALRSTNGSLGCARSHMKLLSSFQTTSRESDQSPLVVFEDDVEFLVDANEIDQAIREFLRDERLDVFLFAYHTESLMPRLPSGLRLVTNSYTTSGYIVKARAIPALVNVASESARRLRSGCPPDECAIDVLWQKLQHHELVFVTGPRRIARQRPGFSDIRGKVKFYGV